MPFPQEILDLTVEVLDTHVCREVQRSDGNKSYYCGKCTRTSTMPIPWPCVPYKLAKAIIDDI